MTTVSRIECFFVTTHSERDYPECECRERKTNTVFSRTRDDDIDRLQSLTKAIFRTVFSRQREENERLVKRVAIVTQTIITRLSGSRL